MILASLNSTNTILSIIASTLAIGGIVIGAVRWGVKRLNTHIEHQVDRAVAAVDRNAVYGQGNREMLVSQQEKLKLPVPPLPVEPAIDAPVATTRP